MAQHISIKSLPQKVFRKIEESIKKDFGKSYMPTTSMKYEWLRRVLRDNDYKDFQEIENDEVFTTSRNIGEGFVWGSNRGNFEVHFDNKNKTVLNIYLVA